MKFNIGHWLINLTLEKFEGMIGVNSTFDINKHVGFCDLDKKNYNQAKEIIQKLQKKYNLNDALLLMSSKGNFHAVFFDLKPFKKWLLINLPINLEHCGYSVFRKTFVLRISKKLDSIIEFKEIIKSEYGKENKLSLPHINFFEKKFNINLKYLKKNVLNNYDGQIYLEFYNARVKRL